MEYENTSGLDVIQSYGPYSGSPFDTNVVVFGVKRQILVPVEAGQQINAGFDETATAQAAVVPAGSYILGAYMYNETAFDAAVDVSVGSSKVISAKTGTTGQWTAGATGINITADSNITTTADTAATSGKGFLVIEYMTSQAL